MRSPADMSLWTGRVDAADGALGLRWHQTVTPWRPGAAPGLALLGLGSDEGVRRNQGRVGAADGPRALRVAMANLPRCDALPIHDAGDVVCEDEALEAAQERFADGVAQLLGDGQFVLGLGGGHEIGYASFLGLARDLPAGGSVGVVNLDAHFDLREAERPSSGTPFLQAARYCREHGLSFRYCCLGVSDAANTPILFQRADEIGAIYERDDALGPARLDEILAAVDRFAAAVDRLYLTICLDVLPAPVAPGVSAPAARGVGLDVVEPIVRRVAASLKLRVADIAELNPRYDIDGRTARVAARLAFFIARERAALAAR